MPPPAIGPRPTAASLGLTQAASSYTAVTEAQSEENPTGELDLDGLDDAELDNVGIILCIEV